MNMISLTHSGPYTPPSRGPYQPVGEAYSHESHCLVSSTRERLTRLYAQPRGSERLSIY